MIDSLSRHSADTPTVTPIAIAGAAAEPVIVRLMRHWVAASDQGAPTLPALVALATRLAVDTQVAIALDSMLALTEACLERPLRSVDEGAVMVLIAQASSSGGGAQAQRAVPHGLPGVLAWAAAMVRHRLAEDGRALAAPPPRRDRCPFAA